jgi:ABC-type multidrug transport system permease subunit
LVILTVLLSALIAVGLGLALGTIVKTKQQLSTWGMILSQPLLIPVFVSAIDPILPEALRTALYWVPTGALALLFRFSFSDGATLAQVGLRVGIALVSAVLILGVVVWKVRRSDR